MLVSDVENVILAPGRPGWLPAGRRWVEPATRLWDVGRSEAVQRASEWVTERMTGAAEAGRTWYIRVRAGRTLT
ncbi:hypothetical protein Ga0074812_107169 [Parafrankia irregularis]|uniref:Uncharacterized protein n=1 Tax=Parafrankia irregularis TaxID=795642 RepID=A0A0S4QLH0_9ACTN|nr:hypothetical protein Ga0074812_107169 [Parafrankia irregularis]